MKRYNVYKLMENILSSKKLKRVKGEFGTSKLVIVERKPVAGRKKYQSQQLPPSG